LTALPETWADPINQILGEVAERGAWSRDDYDAVRRLLAEKWSHTPAKREIEARLEMHARPDEFGELILTALQAYHENFFGEEEERILPALEDAVSNGRRLAKTLPLLSLLEELSQGLRYETMPDVTELILVPSFWSTPLVIQLPLGQSGMLFIFGARPQDASLVPGEFVPDALYQALKALADPTRLRILHDLTAEPMTPSRLARRLRLRAPTVVHHLHTLRLARLVHLTVGKEGKRRYTVRAGAVETTLAALQHFLESEPSADGMDASSEA
jgi:DNA-binding transcriptional ArsR family regulator